MSMFWRAGRALPGLSLLISVLLVCLSAAVSPVLAQERGSISGVAFIDDNGDGVRDPSEGPHVGQLIVILGEEGARFATTEANGAYAFPDLRPGAYEFVVDSEEFDVRSGDRTAPFAVLVEPGQHLTVPIGFAPRCARIFGVKILCTTDGTGDYLVGFTYKNLSSFPVSHIFCDNLPPVSIDSVNPPSQGPNYIPVNPPVPPGGTRFFEIRIRGAQKGPLCLYLEQHNFDGSICCSFKWCMDLPPCDCFQVLYQSIECLPNGGYRWCVTIQNLVPPPRRVKWINIAPPPGVSISQTVFLMNPTLNYGDIATICFDVFGVSPTEDYCFLTIFKDETGSRCCAMNICTRFPVCPCPPGQCRDRAPFYEGQLWAPLVGKNLAVFTCFTGNDEEPVIGIYDINTYWSSAPIGIHWPHPTVPFHGTQTSADRNWTRGLLGTIFGVTLDNRGQIFVTHTSSFRQVFWPAPVSAVRGDAVGFGGAGAIYRLNPVTSKAELLKALPNTLITTPERTPGLGNISWDYDHDQLFVTNHEDGMIYRITNLTGPPNSGIISQTFDPFALDAGPILDPGFCPLGERLWGIQYHQGRVFFSRWVIDNGRKTPPPLMNTPATHNEIWSVAVNGAGAIVPSSLQRELEVPFMFNGTANYSNPVSDISFSPEGRMLLAERSIYYNQTGGAASDQDSLGAHRSRLLEFDCVPGVGWVQIGPGGNPDSHFYGYGGQPYSIAGGCDYDFNPSTAPTSGRRVWGTSDYEGPSTSTFLVYGFMGFPVLGGTSAQSVLVDANDTGTSTDDKYQQGDIEIPCILHDHISGRVTLTRWAAAIDGVRVSVKVYPAGGGDVLFDAQLPLDSEGRFELSAGLAPGDYVVKVKGKCWLRRNASITLDGSNAATVHFVLLGGDINDDNVVDSDDFVLLVEAFGASASSSNWNPYADLDGDGSIDSDDFDILVENFGMAGDD